jgi:hypothetical protein
MSAAQTLPAVATVASPPLNPDWLQPGALAKLLDPSPEWVTGLSDDFLARRYGCNWAGERV